MNSAAAARQLPIGFALPETTRAPSRVDIAWYMVASYDLNPIHVDEPFARTAGFPSVIGQAMIPMGYLSGALVRAVGIERLRSLRGDFVRPVLPDEPLRVRVVLASRNESVDGVELTWQLSATGPDGIDRVRGTAISFHSP